MSESLAFERSPLPDERTATPASKFGFLAILMAALDSLVAAQTRKMDETGPLMYRYPPI